MADLSKAAPRPWRLDEMPRGYVVDATSKKVCDPFWADQDGGEENAVLIVRAVNEREELIASLRNAVEVIETLNPAKHSLSYARLRVISATLAKVSE